MTPRHWITGVATLFVLLVCALPTEAASVLVGTKIKTNEGTKDIYAESKASKWIIYYSSIPRVTNPGRRPHECYSLQELRDELRRARNNGWVVDMRRSSFTR